MHMKNRSIFNSLCLLCIPLLSFILLTSNNTIGYGQKHKTTKQQQAGQFTDEENAGIKLLALAEKGLVGFQFGEITTIMTVEPKMWNMMLHRQKVELCRTALTYLQGYKRVKLPKMYNLIVYDMTSHAEVACGYLDNNSIEIKR